MNWLRAGVAGAAFLIETDPEVIRARYAHRDQTGCSIAGDEARLGRFIPHYLAWARWLEREVSKRGLAIVGAREEAALGEVVVALGLTLGASDGG